MKNLFCLLALVATVCACSISEEKLQGTYEVDLSQTMEDQAEENSSENDLGRELGKALMGNFKMVIEFEENGEGRISMGMGLLEDLAKAFGNEEAAEEIGSTPMGTAMEWKLEEETIYIKTEEQDSFEVFGTVVERDGYERLVLRNDEEGEPEQLVLTRVEKK